MSRPSLPTILSLEEKIQLAENIIIEEYMRNNGNIFISWSGGKDSEVLKHIALRLFPHLKVVYSNTTNEMKEVLEHVKKFPETIVVFPEKSFKQVVKEKGFPLISKEVSQKVNEIKNTNGYRTRMLRYYGNNKGDSKLPETWRFLAEQDFDTSNQCCNILKKEPIKKWAKANGNLKPLIALMSGESRLRQQLALYGKEDGKKIYPFLRTGWDEEDIWAYAKKFNLRFAECYYDRIINGKLVKACSRSGCDSCDYGSPKDREIKFARSKAVSPKKFASMMKVENNGVTYEKAIKIGRKQIETTYLGLFGGIVTNIEFNQYTKSEVYKFKIISDVYECPCCGKKGAKSKYKYTDMDIITSFKDTPNPQNGKRRVIEAHYNYFTCKNCGMTLNNHLHMFDLRFNVTKRLIDYIYENLDTKTPLDIANETGVSIEDIFEIIIFNYSKAFADTKKNERVFIWFDEKNNLRK